MEQVRLWGVQEALRVVRLYLVQEVIYHQVPMVGHPACLQVVEPLVILDHQSLVLLE